MSNRYKFKQEFTHKNGFLTLNLSKEYDSQQTILLK